MSPFLSHRHTWTPTTAFVVVLTLFFAAAPHMALAQEEVNAACTNHSNYATAAAYNLDSDCLYDAAFAAATGACDSALNICIRNVADEYADDNGNVTVCTNGAAACVTAFSVCLTRAAAASNATPTEPGCVTWLTAQRTAIASTPAPEAQTEACMRAVCISNARSACYGYLSVYNATTAPNGVCAPWYPVSFTTTAAVPTNATANPSAITTIAAASTSSATNATTATPMTSTTAAPERVSVPDACAANYVDAYQNAASYLMLECDGVAEYGNATAACEQSLESCIRNAILAAAFATSGSSTCPVQQPLQDCLITYGRCMSDAAANASSAAPTRGESNNNSTCWDWWDQQRALSDAVSNGTVGSAALVNACMRFICTNAPSSLRDACDGQLAVYDVISAPDGVCAPWVTIATTTSTTTSAATTAAVNATTSGNSTITSTTDASGVNATNMTATTAAGGGNATLVTTTVHVPTASGNGSTTTSNATTSNGGASTITGVVPVPPTTIGTASTTATATGATVTTTTGSTAAPGASTFAPDVTLTPTPSSPPAFEPTRVYVVQSPTGGATDATSAMVAASLAGALATAASNLRVEAVQSFTNGSLAAYVWTAGDAAAWLQQELLALTPAQLAAASIDYLAAAPEEAGSDKGTTAEWSLIVIAVGCIAGVALVGGIAYRLYASSARKSARITVDKEDQQAMMAMMSSYGGGYSNGNEMQQEYAFETPLVNHNAGNTTYEYPAQESSLYQNGASSYDETVYQQQQQHYHQYPAETPDDGTGGDAWGGDDAAGGAGGEYAGYDQQQQSQYDEDL